MIDGLPRLVLLPRSNDDISNIGINSNTIEVKVMTFTLCYIMFAWWYGKIVAWWHSSMVAWYFVRWYGNIMTCYYYLNHYVSMAVGWHGDMMAWWHISIAAWWHGGIAAWWHSVMVFCNIVWWCDDMFCGLIPCLLIPFLQYHLNHYVPCWHGGM